MILSSNLQLIGARSINTNKLKKNFSFPFLQFMTNCTLFLSQVSLVSRFIFFVSNSKNINFETVAYRNVPNPLRIHSQSVRISVLLMSTVGYGKDRVRYGTVQSKEESGFYAIYAFFILKLDYNNKLSNVFFHYHYQSREIFNRVSNPFIYVCFRTCFNETIY